MSRLLVLSLVTGLVSLNCGCSMCCAPFDCDYPSVAGRWARHNPSSGRVGSAFDEAGGPAEALLTSAVGEPTLAQPTMTEPIPPQGIYRAPAGTYTQPPTRMAPGTRSVIPRNMGENYLPRGQ
jgi:hypothetical protein